MEQEKDSNIIEEWMFAFVDALIRHDLDTARHIAYEHEGEQLSFF